MSEQPTTEERVIGSLEGEFVQGQLYKMLSRVRDPTNFMLIGLPPKDLIEDVAEELHRSGIDVDAYFEDACKVTGEWHDRTKARLVDRIPPNSSDDENSIPLEWNTLAECLNPETHVQVGQANG